MQPITVNLKKLLAELENVQNEKFMDNYLKGCSPESEHRLDCPIQEEVEDTSITQQTGLKRAATADIQPTQFKITNNGAQVVDITGKEENYTVIVLSDSRKSHFRN